MTDSAISNTSEEDDEELGEDLGDLDDLLASLRSEEAVAPKRGRSALIKLNKQLVLLQTAKLLVRQTSSRLQCSP